MLRRGFYKNGYSTMEIKRRRARWKKKRKKKEGREKEEKKERREGRGGKKKSGVLFSTVKTVATQAAGMETAHDLLVNVGIDFQLLAFQKR